MKEEKIEKEIKMSNPIDSEEEYERRKNLIEKHKDDEKVSFKKDVISKTISGVIDITGISDVISETISKSINKSDD